MKLINEEIKQLDWAIDMTLSSVSKISNSALSRFIDRRDTLEAFRPLWRDLVNNLPYTTTTL